jgi:hypothetical protein
MINFRNSFILLVMSALFSGCATTTPTIPTVSDREAFKYEKEYLAEYELLKNNFSNSSSINWVQPSNKKEPCKIYMGFDLNDENFKSFWDGDCKDGYAYGLGREFMRGTVLNGDSLAIYQGKKEKPQYFIEKDNLGNVTTEGDINNKYYVKTTISENNLDFNISYEYGFFGSTLYLITMSSPFDDNILYEKRYPNFAYYLYDMSNNEFDERKFQFETAVRNGSLNYFAYKISKKGQLVSWEVVDGKATRRVQLPDSYFTKIGQIYNEIAQASQKAIDAQKKALRIKKQYMIKICKDSIHVKFIVNSEYKSICNESVNNDLKEKIENKFAQINSQKKQKREQLNQQKIIDAQVAQANAAQRQANATARNAAAAAQRQANAQARQNLNNQVQDLADSLQQSNSYSWPSMPASSKSYKPYNSNTPKIQNCYTAGGIEFCN